MREEKIGFGIFIRVGVSLLPILFGLTLPAMIWCSFHIAMSYIAFGPLTSLISSLCAICISMFFHGLFGADLQIEGLFMALQSIFCAAACVFTVVKRKDFYTGAWLSAIGFLIPCTMSIKNAATNAGLSITDYLTKVPVESLRIQIESSLKEAGVEIEALQLDKIFESVQNLVAMIVPAIIIVMSIIVGYIVIWCVCARLRKVPGAIQHSFSEIRIPRTMVIIIALVIGLLFLDVEKTVNYVAVNLLMILLCLCFFAGMSILDYYLRSSIKWKFARVMTHGVIILFSSSFLNFSPYINIMTVYILLAIADSFFDFRKIRKRRTECETETEKRES